MKTSFSPQKDGEIEGYEWCLIKNLPVGKCWNSILCMLHSKIMDEYMFNEYGLKKFSKRKKEIRKNNKMNKIVTNRINYRSIEGKKYYTDVSEVLTI